MNIIAVNDDTLFRGMHPFGLRAVRTDEWKLIRYSRQNFIQLFNLKNDPLELKNFVEEPNNKGKTVEKMTSLLDT